MFIATEQDEKRYLEEIKSKIRDAIHAGQQAAKRKSAELLEQKQYVRENKDERSILHQAMSQTAGRGEAAMARVKQLRRLLLTPYFGRIDFKENGQKETLPVYIGICALNDKHAHANLIYDWRAPISSMFYDFEIGHASYQSPSGKIEGDITLKRQYRIKDGQLEFMINTSEHIYDDLLQKELSMSSDEKMKNIVATIQKDQNAIIRDENSKVLIIQGVAGSGKTSIALHRIAFLLYKNRETLSSNDILILSPNQVFSDYISNVLPELGEENIPESSMDELINDILENKFQYQNLFEQTTSLIKKNDQAYKQRISFKSSSGYLDKLNGYILFLSNNFFQPAAIKVGRYTVPPTTVYEKYQSYHRQPLLNRTNEMVGAISLFLLRKYKYEVTASDKRTIKRAIVGMSGTTNILRLYKGFFVWMGEPGLFKMHSRNTLEYHDAFGLAYLKLCVEGFQPNRKVKHLLIDEMQDYSPIHYAIISKMFTCKMTFLGDINQSLNPGTKIELATLTKLFPQSQQMKLTQSYRSTYEIIHFAQQIAYNNELIPVERHGRQPKIYIEKDSAAETSRLIHLIKEFAKNKEHKSLAIICKTEDEAVSLAAIIKPHHSIKLLTTASMSFTDGVIITYAQLAKGLEFDKVIVPSVNKENYKTEIEKSILYIACTRAMHELDITCTKTPSSFIHQNGLRKAK